MKLSSILFRQSVKLIKTGDVLQVSRNFSASAVNNMRFVQFQKKEGGPKQIGAQLSVEGDIFEISALDSTIPNCMVKFLALDGAIDKAKRLVGLFFYKDLYA